MKRLVLCGLLILAACQPKPHYVTYPVETVDSLRAYLAGPATLKVYDSAGTKWLLVQPRGADGKALLSPAIKPLNHANECPPYC